MTSSPFAQLNALAPPSNWRALFGWRRESGRMRFRKGWLETGKGQAKSPLMAAIVTAQTLAAFVTLPLVITLLV